MFKRLALVALAVFCLAGDSYAQFIKKRFGNQFPESTSPSSSSYVPVHDPSSNITVNVKLSNLSAGGGASAPSGTVVFGGTAPIVAGVAVFSDVTGTNLARSRVTIVDTNLFAGTVTSTNSISIGTAPATGAFLNFGTNSGGYLMRSASQSGISTNLGFSWTHNATLFDTNAAPDEVSHWGYNVTPGGGQASANDTAIFYTVEGNFNSGGASYAEAHLQFVKTNTQFRPIYWRINKNNFADVVNTHWLYDFKLTDSANPSNPEFFTVNPGNMTFTSTNANAVSKAFRISDDGTNVQFTRRPGTANQGNLQMNSALGWTGVYLPAAQFLGTGHTITADTAFNSAVYVQGFDNSSNKKWQLASASGFGLQFASDRVVKWQSATSIDSGSADLGFARDAPGVLRVTDGSTGTGKLKVGLIQTPAVAATIASSATIAPTAALTFISGTAAIDTITAPSPISSTGGIIAFMPTGAFTLTTSGNVSKASTAVVGQVMLLAYDATAAKWHPSY